MEKEEFQVNYKEDRHIDEENLHVEWLRQSDITSKYVFYYAQKKKEANITEKEKELAFANLDEQIRQQPEKFKMEKLTDASIKQAIIRQDQYQQKIMNNIEAQYEAGIAYGALQDMRERKEILSGLNYLYNTGYFDVPDENRNIATDRKSWEAKRRRERERGKKKEQEMNDSIAESLNKSKNKKK